MKMHRVKNVLWGIVLLLVAIGLILYKMVPGFTFLPSISIWQILLGLACISAFLDGIITRNHGSIFFSLAFFGIIFGKQLHIEALVPWTLLIVALLATIAFNLIFGEHHHKSHHGERHGRKEVTPETVEGDIICENVSFTGATKYIRSEHFSKAELNCSFSGTEVYFDKVQVPSGSATIVLHAKYSGVELYVPKDWKIVNNMDCFFGGIDIDDRWSGDESVTIYLEGSNRFGGVDIKRV